MTAKRICSVPWYEIWINPEFKYGLCCKENQSLVQHNDSRSVGLDQHWYGGYMVDLRRRFINGDAVPECDLCWRNEADGKTSMRQRRNLRYLGRNEVDDIDMQHLIDNIESRSLIQGLNLSCGNLCQLRCITCNPNYSRSIKKDYDRLGWPIHEKSRFAVTAGTDQVFSLTVDDLDRLKLITPQLQWINLAGGEPTISRPLHDYLGWCVDQGHSQHIRLIITTNGVNVKESFMDLLDQFQKVSITVSVDGHGALDEYLRYPSNWQKKMQFVDACQLRFPDMDLHTVLYGLNVLAVDRLIDFASERGLRHSLEYIMWPRSLAVANLPTDLIQLSIERLTRAAKLVQSRQSNFRCVSDWHRSMECVQAMLAHCQQAVVDPAWAQMQDIIRSYDTIRSTSLDALIPELQGRY
jgi:molybdenum cofactor biosynthesis enzyme MoaA